MLQPVGARGLQALEPDGAQGQQRALAQRRLLAPRGRQGEQGGHEAAARPRGAAQHDVVEHARLADHARGLEGARDAAGRASARGAQGQRRLAHDDAALVRVDEAADGVERGGLAAAVRADEAVYLAGADQQVQAVDRAHRAEAQRHPAQGQARGGADRLQQAGEQRGPRQHRAVQVQRAAAGAIQQLGDAAGCRQHDQQQQGRVEEGGPRDQGCGELRQHGQQRGGEQRAQHRAAAADQHRGEEQHGQVEGEGVGRDVALQGREQRAGDPGGRAAEGEHGEQQAPLVHAAAFGRHLRVAQRDQAAAEPAAPGVDGQPGHQRRHRHAQRIEPGRAVERRGEGRSGQADAAAGDARPGQRHLGHDGGEAERAHGEVEGPQAQRRQPDQHAAGRAREPRRGQGERRRHAELLAQRAGGVGAHGQQRDVADRQLPGEAHDQVQARHQHPVDGRTGGDDGPVVLPREGDRDDGQHQQQPGQHGAPCARHGCGNGEAHRLARGPRVFAPVEAEALAGRPGLCPGPAGGSTPRPAFVWHRIST